MSRATDQTGQLQELKNCKITVGGSVIPLKVVPEITDSKSAAYNDEPIIGRSIPLKTFSHGENRSITMNVHFVVTQFSDIQQNLQYLRTLESAVYPRDEPGSAAPYLPPPICKLECGQLFGTINGGNGPVCAVMKSYSVSFPDSVPWDDDDTGIGTYLPYKITVNLQFDVIYRTEVLPGAERILQTGGAR